MREWGYFIESPAEIGQDVTNQFETITAYSPDFDLLAVYSPAVAQLRGNCCATVRIMRYKRIWADENYYAPYQALTKEIESRKYLCQVRPPPDCRFAIFRSKAKSVTIPLTFMEPSSSGREAENRVRIYWPSAVFSDQNKSERKTDHFQKQDEDLGGYLVGGWPVGNQIHTSASLLSDDKAGGE
jgi:hypothetical protein